MRAEDEVKNPVPGGVASASMLLMRSLVESNQRFAENVFHDCWSTSGRGIRTAYCSRNDPV
jgi:hypothetical protein